MRREERVQRLVLSSLVILALATLATAPLAHAGLITGITTANSGKLVNLTSLTVDRDSAGSFTYTADQLIGIDVTAFTGASAGSLIIADGDAIPAAGNRAALLDSDNALNTGIINFTTSGSALAVHFLSPLKNDPGPDLVFFEINGGTTPNGEAVIAILGSNTYTASNYVRFMDPSVLKMDTLKPSDASIPTSLALLESKTFIWNSNADGFNPWGVAIDLSNLGVAPGDSISDLSFRSASSAAYVDPVFIAGLPAVPEPSVLGLFGFALLLARRTRRS